MKILGATLNKRRLPNLTWLRSFEAAGRQLSFTAAGAELGLTQSAISLHIKALEADLGCRLFIRHGAVLELTDQGHAYLVNVTRSLSDLEGSTRRMFGAADERVVTVRTSISTAALWLTRLLPEFYAANPEIRVKLLTTIWADGTNQAESDIVLRLGTSDAPPVDHDFAVEEPVALVTAKSGPVEPEELAQLGLIGILGHEADWDQFYNLHGMAGNPVQLTHEFDTTLCAYKLLRLGQGCGLILERMLGADDGLFKPFGTFLTNHVHYVRVRRHDPDVQVFADWILVKLKQPNATSANLN